MNLRKCENGHYYDWDKFASCPYCETNTKTAAGIVQTMEIASELIDKNVEHDITAPKLPVGILVAAAGTMKGMIYTLYRGENALKVTDGSIHILSASDKADAVITYYLLERKFMIKALQKKVTVCLGSEKVLQSTSLTAYDRIQIGEFPFLFVPICNESFTW